MAGIDVAGYYEKYAPMVFRRCRSILGSEDEALDAVQDVFLSLIRRRKKLQGRFPSSLLYTMATNTCLNRLRGRRRAQKSLGENSGDPEVLALGEPDPGFAQVEEEIVMEAVLRDESESTRMICFMYHRDRMTLGEIGELMGMSISGVRKRLAAFNARARIKAEGGTYE